MTPKIDHFAWRVEQLVQEGGFALITGESGTGKSVALRIVAGRLAALRDVVRRCDREAPVENRRLLSRAGRHLRGEAQRRTIVGADSKHCASAGRPTWPRHGSARCSWSTKPRR